MFYQVSVTVWWLLLSKSSSLLSWRLLSHKDFPGGSDGKEPASNVRDPGVIPGSGRSPGEENGNPLQYSWAFLVAQTAKNLPTMQETQVWSLGQEDPLEEEMATHSSVLGWRIPWTEESGRLQFMGSQRVGDNWATNSSNKPFFPLTSQCLIPREFTSKLYFKKLGIWFEIIKVEKFNTWTNSITRLWVRENEVKEKWEKEVNFLSYKEILVIKKSTE